jgi:hypothetical protein
MSVIDEISIYSLSVLATCFDHIWSSSGVQDAKNVVNVTSLDCFTLDSLLLVSSYANQSSKDDTVNYNWIKINVGKSILLLL